jgi:hypothetical protein
VAMLIIKNIGMEIAKAGITGYIHAIVGGTDVDLYINRNHSKPIINPDIIEAIVPSLVAFFQYNPIVIGPKKQANIVPNAAPTISTIIPVLINVSNSEIIANIIEAILAIKISFFSLIFGLIGFIISFVKAADKTNKVTDNVDIEAAIGAASIIPLIPEGAIISMVFGITQSLSFNNAITPVLPILSSNIK